MSCREGLSGKWRATLQVGEVRIIAFRPARHTEVNYLVKVQVIEFADCIPSAETIAEKEPEVEERFPSARIYANLHVVRSPWLSACSIIIIQVEERTL